MRDDACQNRVELIVLSVVVLLQQSVDERGSMAAVISDEQRHELRRDVVETGVQNAHLVRMRQHHVRKNLGRIGQARKKLEIVGIARGKLEEARTYSHGDTMLASDERRLPTALLNFLQW